MAPTDWTPERVAILTEMYRQKRSSTEIAARLGGGLTRNAVIGKASRLGLTGSKGAGKPENPWPRKAVAQLKKLHAQGSTFAAITRALGEFTEAAIRAQMKRMNLTPATRAAKAAVKSRPAREQAARSAPTTARGKSAPARAKPAAASAGKANAASTKPKTGAARTPVRVSALKVAPKREVPAAKTKSAAKPEPAPKTPPRVVAKAGSKPATKPAPKAAPKTAAPKTAAPKTAARKTAAPKTVAPPATTRAKAAPAVPKAAAQAAPPVVVPPSAPPARDTLPRMLSLVELDEHSCRWPIGDPQLEDFGFCGLPAVPGKPYCAVHVGDAYQPLTSRRDRERARIR